MGLFDRFKKNREALKMPQFLYDENEINEIDNYICEAFGTYSNVFHELVSPDVHLDVCIVSPTEEQPFYKLVTMGAGAYSMKVPEQMAKYNLSHAEYVIYLPKDWNVGGSEINDFWPIKLLKDTARLPIWCDTWLCYGHTTQADEEGTAYAPNTGFNSIVLDFAENEKGEVRLNMSSGKVINFYEIIPLYPEELNFKMANDADALFEKFKEKGISFKVVDIHRKNAIK